MLRRAEAWRLETVGESNCNVALRLARPIRLFFIEVL
mgnify:CR=1 FL=1